LDTVLGINAKRDQFGSFVFTNYLESTPVTYKSNGSTVQYEGYQFYQIKNTNPVFGNGWHKAPNRSRQYILNDLLNITVSSSNVPFVANIDQLPAINITGQPATCVASFIRNEVETVLSNQTDYITQLDPLSLLPTIIVSAGILTSGDRLIVKTWNNAAPILNNGYFELPLNLVANPNNKEFTTISQSQFLDQFKSIIQNQEGFVGQAFGANNYRDTAGKLSFGNSILQHRAPMLKLMLLNSRDVTNGIYLNQGYTDPMIAMQFAQKEYLKFYGKFIRALFNLYKNGYGLTNTQSDWISTVLKQINIGKTATSTWVNSGYDTTQASYCSMQSSTPTYIPPTASRLGVAPVYQPTVYVINQNIIIQTHDGSRIIMQDDSGNPLGMILGGLSQTTSPSALSNPIAAAWLQFELNIYNNIPSIYNNVDAELVLDIRKYSPGKWRTSDYTVSEYNAILLPMFDKWVILNQVDYTANTTFDLNDQFTFNYSSILDAQGQPVPGYWRGIYRYYYDTDRPHNHPWEMLGFSQKPIWWDAEYGVAPYTNGNTHLWYDLRDGIIRQGARAGRYSTWARPGLMQCIPVDSQGNLLPPFLAGTVSSLPSIDQAKSNWQFGDGGPVESVWIHSQDYNFAIAQQSYLMKPAQFIEYCWDTPRTKQIYAGTSAEQWIYIDTNSRRESGQFYVHRENPVAIGMNINITNESDLTYFGSCGIQHWISEYLVSQSLNVTTYFGSLVRGGVPKLTHKVGSYINSSENSLRMTADSFGTIGYRSLLVPSENINTYLYRSASIGESFYGGVILKQVSNGWQVYGYDGINLFFNVIPSVITGPKVSSVIGYQQLTTYLKGQTKNGNPVIAQVPYGTIFPNRQQAYDFLVSYGRWLENEGWIFDTYNNQNNSITDWKQAGVEFVYWSQANWANGNFIALSPFANSAKFKQSFGNIEFVSGVVNGTYPVLDKTGALIDSHNLEILRYDDEIIVRPLNEQSIYGLRLFRTTIEHVIVIDNFTSFGDTIYDDQFNDFQPRLKLYAYRTNDWSGRLDAPGYFLYQNPNDNTWTMISNFEKTADDFRKYFNIEQPKNFDLIDSANQITTTLSSANNVIDRSDIANLSKHLFGYQQRQYLEDLLLEDSTEFEFYQGFIRQKGTANTISNITRNSSIIDPSETFEYYEEFGLRAGRYGAVALNSDITFIIPQDQLVNDPQQINIFSTLHNNNELNGVIQMTPNDNNFVVAPNNNSQFPLRNYYGNNINDLPNSGYVELAETDHYVVDVNGLLSLYSTVVLNNRDTIWQFIDVQYGWTVWQFTQSPNSIITTSPSTNGITTINCDTSGLNDNDIVTLVGISNVDVLNSTFTISNVTDNSFDVPQSSFISGTGGTIYVYNRVRFNTTRDRDSNPPIGGWKNGDMSWVDNGDITTGAWTVYQYLQNTWSAIRTENFKVAADLMTEANLFGLSAQTKLAEITYYDPGKGFIPGIADIDLDFKTIYDPARYNQGDTSIHIIDPTSAWENKQIGLTWWDLSTIRYIDYEIGTDTYKWKNWGKIAPGTSVDVYEWVRSPVQPTSWANYVAQGLSFSQFGINYIPTGTVKNSDNPAWTQTTEYDSSGNPSVWYYFWVKNSTTVPLPNNRDKTTLEISNIIKNPSAAGVIWYAAIDSTNIIVSGISTLVNDNDTAMQMIYSQKPNDSNDHKQWELFRNGDANCTINEMFWRKLHDSLTGFDSIGNPVPDTNLNQYQRYGTLIRPRQTWFKDRIAASEIYINKVNDLLSTIAIRDDSNVVGWLDYFSNKEPIPAQAGNWDISASSIAYRNSIQNSLTDGQRVLVLPTIDTNYLWVIYEWAYQSQSWITVRIQSWNTENYWEYIDWYDASNNVSNTTIPNYIVNTISDISTIAAVDGIIIKVLNNGSNLWELYTYVSGVLTRVGLQSGTIQVLSSLYDGSVDTSEFDNSGFDSSAFDANPSIEYGYIFNGIKFAIFGTPQVPNSSELNEIFFSMINYVISEQGFVDWIMKTSYIVLKGFNQPFDTSTLYQSDNIDSLLSYINEVRPYRSKIREFISGRTISDNAMVQSSDFDLPPYQGRILDPSNPSDVDIISTNSLYQPWYNNYTTNPDLIRTIKTQILFDRVATESYGWDTNPWDSSFWSYESGADATFGAFDRIQLYYQPTEGMTPIDSEDLISVTGFRGNTLDGVDFNMTKTGWNSSSWSNVLGWNATPGDIDEYIDIVIQGGIVPKYDSFYGDNVTKTFKLSKIPQDVSKSAVWSDSQLRVYGKDWIIPNWITGVKMVSNGTGYQVGDILKVGVPNSVSEATVTVTQIDSNGGITGININSNGRFDIIENNLVDLIYPEYAQGIGQGATVDIQLGGDSILFKVAPKRSDNKSVYILYSGETFEPAPNNEYSIITDGNGFVQPNYGNDHAEELYSSRLISSTRIDVFTQPVGGRPKTSIRSYQSDGKKDQFELLVKPQDKNAVIVQLNGNILTYGPDNDYVINFITNKIVFTEPPAAGLLQIISFGTGGSSVGIIDPKPLTRGTNYVIGDTITLFNNGIVNNNYPVVSVSSITAVGYNIVSGGVGYNIGDMLVMNATNDTTDAIKLLLTVSRISDSGQIISLNITESGSYTYDPTYIVFKTNNNGSGANIEIVWGVNSLAIVNQGLFSIKPNAPLIQYNTSGNGSGLTVETLYTNTIGRDVIEADGITNSYSLSFSVQDIGQLLITVDGTVLKYTSGDFTYNNGIVALNNTPVLNSIIIITGFNGDAYSVIHEQDITIVDGQYTYNLDYIPAHTNAAASSILVLRNGVLMSPPSLNTYVGDNITTIFKIKYIPSYAIGLNVYVNSNPMTLGTDFALTIDSIEFYTAPAAGAIISIVITNQNYSYDYLINGNQITFQNSNMEGWNTPTWNTQGWGTDINTVMVGDEIRIITFTEDLSYGWITESKESTGKSIYSLQSSPYDDNLIMVFVNGQLLTLMSDYKINNEYSVITNNYVSPAVYPVTPLVSGSVYSAFMNQYGVWVDPNPYSLDRAGETLVTYRNIYSPYDGQYTILYQADNQIMLYIDDEFIGSSTDFESNNPTSSNIHLTKGNHIIKFMTLNYPLNGEDIQNQDIWLENPGSWATVIIDNKTNDIIWDTRTFSKEEIITSLPSAVQTTVNYPATIEFGEGSTPATGSQILIMYASGKDNRPPIAWRTLIDTNANSQSTAIDDMRKTFILSNVYLHSNEIEIADITRIGSANNASPSSVWINNELITYYGVRNAATLQYPNRGFLTSIQRGISGTPNLPQSAYDTLYYYGDNENKYFATGTGSQILYDTVYVDNKLVYDNDLYPSIGSYTIQINPVGAPSAGRYVVFNNDAIPDIGWRNVKITSYNIDFDNTAPIHVTNSEVIDASQVVMLPGGYNWEPAENGLQYSASNQGIFLRQHAGTNG